MRGSLSTRAKTLIAVPVISHLLLLSILAVLLFDMQKEVNREQNSRELLAELNMFTCQMLSDLLLFNLTRHDDSAKALLIQRGGAQVFIRRDEVKRKVREEWAKEHRDDSSQPKVLAEVEGFYKEYKLRFLNIEDLPLSPRMRNGLDKLRDYFNLTLELAKHTAQFPNEPQQDYNKRRKIIEQETIRSTYNLIDYLEELSKADEEDRLASPIRSTEIRNQVMAILVVALVMSVLLAAWMAWLYGRGIAKPLKQIANNGRKIGTNEQLEKTISGAGELTELDLVLHFVADSVQLALTREKALIANAADWICSLDRNGEIKSINPYANKLLGREPESLLGLSVQDLVITSQVFDAAEALRKACLTEEVQSFELTVAHTDGRQIETRWTCFWSETEKRLFCVVHDMTEANETARQKTAFVNLISHDLRAPLTSIHDSMNAIAAGNRGNVSKQAATEAHTIENNTAKMMLLIDELLASQNMTSKSITLDVGQASIEEIIKESFAVVKDVAESKQIELDMLSNGTILSCDHRKLVQITINLLSNAIKFSPKESKITVAVRELADSIEVSITDSGPGIPPEMSKQIFEPYTQLAVDTRQGTGLGLAICKAFVEAHGGSIGVRPADFSMSDSNSSAESPENTFTTATESASVKSTNGATTNDTAARGTAMENPLSIGSTFWYRIPTAPGN